jgi:hypothetical protein
MRNTVLGVIAAGLATLATVGAHAQGKPQGALGGAAIKKYFSSTRLYGTTPSGKTWLIDFRADGTFTGVVARGEDSGKWWVEGDTLCRSWTGWAGQDGPHSKAQACFWIVLDPAKKRVNYYRKDGSLYRSWRMG